MRRVPRLPWSSTFWVCVWLACGCASDHSRIALVVGNAAYQHAAPLRNPANDARAVSQTLRALGWEVVTELDTTRGDITESARAIGPRLESADEVIFFYAGHGLQINGENYLVPIDFDPARPVVLHRDLVPLRTTLEFLKRPRNQLVVFLDACRNNPMQEQLEQRTQESGRGLVVKGDEPPEKDLRFGQGLAEVETSAGTFISYATQPGNVARDGAGANSPFTAALVRHLGTRNRDISTVLQFVRNEVIGETQGAQVPWDHSSLMRPVVVNVERVPAPVP